MGSHEDILLTRYNLALLFLKDQKYDDAFELFKDLYNKRKVLSSRDDPEVARILLDQAEALIPLRKLEEAKDLCVSAMEVFEKARLPLQHPYLKRCQKLLKS